MNNVKLFTLQNAKTQHQLERDGRIINNRRYVQLHLGDIASLFLSKYDWLATQAALRLPKPNDVTAPIWCAVSPRSCMSPDANSVVYCLEVPEDQILFFDNFKWDYVLNQIYLPQDAADEQAYKRHLEEIGVPSRFDFTKGLYRNTFPEEITRIVESWQRIFDIDEWNPWNVCANIWEIRAEWVTRIIQPDEAIDVDELEHCAEGVVLFDHWPEGFVQRTPQPSPEESNGAPAPKAPASTNGHTPAAPDLMLSQESVQRQLIRTGE